MNERDRASRIHFKTILALTVGLWMLVIGTGIAIQAALKHEDRRRDTGTMLGNSLAPAVGLALVPVLHRAAKALYLGEK